MGNQLQSRAVIACTKTFLLAYNIFFWLIGLLLLIAGVWAELELQKYVELSPDCSGTAPHVIVGISGLILLISSVAFSCVYKGQPVLLFIYGGFLICIFMMEVGVGVAAAVYRDTFAESLYDGLTTTLTSKQPNKANFNLAQSTLHCCGVTNYTDWIRLSPQRVIPMSCCIDHNNCVTANHNDVYQDGCYEVILGLLEGNMDLLIGMAIGSGCLPLMGAIMSCFLAKIIQKSKYDNVN